jgi:plasmid replication initiation protein
MYRTDENLEFKVTEETNNSINYLDMTIGRSINGIEKSIYRKTTSTDITIQHTSNHPQDHKIAAYRYYINRRITLPNTERARKQERKYILSTAQHNDIPAHKIVKDSKIFDCRIKEYLKLPNTLFTSLLHGAESFLRS